MSDLKARPTNTETKMGMHPRRSGLYGPTLHSFAKGWGRQGYAGMEARLATAVSSLDGLGSMNKVTSLDPGTGFTVRAAWFPT